jgi:acyl-coenzyme A thioesterase PaaI-like protein
MSFKNKLFKIWNFWPPFFFTGIRIKEVSEDNRHLIVKLKLRFWNKNYFGTQFGGAMFTLTDPFYMVMLIKNLGSKYVVWDKSATIHYLKPGRTDLTAEFNLTEEDLASIRSTLEAQNKMEWSRTIEIKDANGIVVAQVDKILSIKKKSPS